MIKHSKLQISLYSKKHCIYIFAKLQGREVSEDFHWGAGERVFNPNKNDIFEICFFWGGEVNLTNLSYFPTRKREMAKNRKIVDDC